jgi:predicted DNA-binding protein with PD1-like motif
MKIIIQDKESYIVRFDRGEELVIGLIAFVVQENIGVAHFTAIGAAGELLLSYYSLPTKEYQDHEIKEDMEIAGLVGNVAYMNNKPVIHAHGTFSRPDLSVIGGHVKKLVVSATCEVHLSQLGGHTTRGFDEETGLNLLQ